MSDDRLSIDQLVEVRGFKWPRRATSIAMARFLGEDRWGRWLHVAVGSAWWTADGSRRGTFTQPLVKVIPYDTFWTACFHPVDPIVDVDIVLPVVWIGSVVEEVDLELDILGSTDGTVSVRDHDVFAQVRETWDMPVAIARQALATGEQIHALVARGAEPFNSVGRTWLARAEGISDHNP